MNHSFYCPEKKPKKTVVIACSVKIKRERLRKENNSMLVLPCHCSN